MKETRLTPYLPAAVFTLLAVWFACLYWLLIRLAQEGRLPFAMGPFDFSLVGSSIPGLLLGAALRMFGPALAAALTLAYFQGKPGLAGWGRSLVRWRVPGRLYLLAFLGPLAVSALIVAAGYPLGLLQFEPAQVHPLKFVLLFFLIAVFDGPLGEEPGWRGLLLPELLKQLSPLKAGLAVGVVWYLWHIPLYLADGKALHPMVFLVNVLSLSVVFTWFYIKSSRSTLIAILLHTSTNYALFLIIKCFTLPHGIDTLQLIYDAILVLAATAAALDMREPKRLAPAAV